MGFVSGVRSGVSRVGPGLAVVFALAIAAILLARQYGGSAMLFAVLLGLAVNFVGQAPRYGPGLTFASRPVLQIGVVLLGARISPDQVGAIGLQNALGVGLAVIATIGFGAVVGVLFRRGSAFGVLTGGSVAICGASAALALAAAMPAKRIGDRETAFVVVGVTALGTISMILFPVIAGALGLTPDQTGLFLGASIHDVAQVVGAGYGVSERAGDIATLTKLIRVTMLVPVVILVAILFGRSGPVEGRAGWGRLFRVPPFLVGFVLLAIANGSGLIPTWLAAGLIEVSTWCLITAIAAVGVRTSLKVLGQVGKGSIGIMVAESLFLSLLVLALVVWVPTGLI